MMHVPCLPCGLQAYKKALAAEPSSSEAAEQLAVVLTDLGTRLKLNGSVQEGISKYYEAIGVDPKYAVSTPVQDAPPDTH